MTIKLDKSQHSKGSFDARPKHCGKQANISPVLESSIDQVLVTDFVHNLVHPDLFQSFIMYGWRIEEENTGYAEEDCDSRLIVGSEAMSKGFGTIYGRLDGLGFGFRNALLFGHT